MIHDPFPTSGVPYYRDKKVCVTGATGLIGSYAVKLLKESGAHVRAICHRRRENEYTRLANIVAGWDLSRQDDARNAVHGCDVVIGCAGITGGVNLPKIDPVSYVGPATAIAINTIHACHLERVERFGYLSSTTVYAPSNEPVIESDVKGDDVLYPLYRGIGWSKRFLEVLCRYYHETTGLGVGVVRPSGAYGRFDNFDERSSHVLPGMVTRAMRGEATFEVWGDGEDVRDIIHAQDVARCLLLATAGMPDATPFNAASGKAITTLSLAGRVLEAVGSMAIINLHPEKPSALRTRLVDASRAAGLINFRAEISLLDGIKDVVAWRRAE